MGNMMSDPRPVDEKKAPAPADKNRGKNERRGDRGGELEINQQEDDEQGQRQDDRQRLLGVDLFNVVSGKEIGHARGLFQFPGRHLRIQVMPSISR